MRHVTNQVSVPQVTVQATPRSTPRAQQTPTSSPSSSPSPYPTLASLMPRKTRSLREIYDVDTINSFLAFALFSQIDDA